MLVNWVCQHVLCFLLLGRRMYFRDDTEYILLSDTWWRLDLGRIWDGSSPAAGTALSLSLRFVDFDATNQWDLYLALIQTEWNLHHRRRCPQYMLDDIFAYSDLEEMIWNNSDAFCVRIISCPGWSNKMWCGAWNWVFRPREFVSFTAAYNHHVTKRPWGFLGRLEEIGDQVYFCIVKVHVALQYSRLRSLRGSHEMP